MNVHFYIDNEEETEIMSMSDVPIEPFKVGDIINLSVDDLVPADTLNYPDSLYVQTTNKNKETKELFNLNTIQIKRMGRYARFNAAKEAVITIEYHCLLLVNVKS